MKKTFYLFSAFAFALVSNAFSQKATMELTFTAEYYDQYVPLDSIYVENLTQGGDTMLYAPDTVLVFVYVGVTTNPASNESFRVLQNCPNPFAEQTTISIFLPEADHLQVSVVNLLGQKVAFFERSLDAGNHTFVFYPGDDKYYILTATANGLAKTIKMVSLNNHSSKQVSLRYQKPDDDPIVFKSFQELNDFGFNMGDELNFIGYTGLGHSVIIDSPTENKTYEFQFGMNFPCPGTPSVIYEGQTYQTVQIGWQCWFKENLNVGTMIQGSQAMTDNGIIEKFCYNNDPANCVTYGGLYQWNEMMQYTTQQGTQGICPNGWHIPTDAEWTTLIVFLGGGFVAGGKMKSTGTIEAGTGLWYAPNLGATNSSGFTAFPGGLRYATGYFYFLGINALFWSSTEYGTSYARFRYLVNGADVLAGYDNKFNGFSSRCLKD